MILKVYFLCALLALAAAPAGGTEGATPVWRPEGVSLVVSASPTRVTVGDRILYTLGITVQEGVTVTPPAVGQKLGDFRIRELGREPASRGKDGRRAFSFLYDLRAYETGDKYIPPLGVVLSSDRGQTAELDAGRIAVVVESVLDKDPKDIKDIKPPLGLSYVPVRMIIWLGAGAAAAVAAVILVSRRKRRGDLEGPSPLPPHVIAYAELQRLLEMNLIARGRVKEYYIRLSDIVRRYIERRFGLRAPDRTTEEFLAEASASGSLDARARTLVGDFLEQCDMVKFAKYGPTHDEIDGASAAAKRFVDETRQPEGGQTEQPG
jgi:hypothetical protein